MWVHVVIFVMILCALTGWKKGWIPSSGIGGKDGIRLFAVVAIAGNLLGMILTLQNGGQVYPQGYRLEKEDTGSYEKEFMVSVDGDTSTNDTVLLLANGQAGNPKITEKNADYEEFKKALNYVNTTLAKKIAGDGEGATALFEVKVIGAATKAEAVTLSKSVVTSSLTKAAIYGHDANWGRILCALGYSGVQFDPEKVDLYFESKAGKIKIIENGVSTGYSERGSY